MKKQLIFFLLILVSLNLKATPRQAQLNIQRFIQVWGLIKYKSPSGISGSFDADKVFLAHIDAVGKADEATCNELLRTLLNANTTGLVQAKPRAEKARYLDKNLDGNWIKSFPKNLQPELKLLFNHVNITGKHHYLSPDGKNAGLVPNEAPYAEYDFKSEAMNLLALAKAWAAIEYLFPYKYVIGHSWQSALSEFIPVFSAVDSRTSYEKAVLMLENAINDTHAGGFLDQLKTSAQIFKTAYYPPFDYQVNDWKIVVKSFLNDSLAKVSAVNTGDQILAINGIAIAKWLRERSNMLPASNGAVKQRHLSSDLKGRTLAFSDLPAKVLRVKVRRSNAVLELNLEMLERSNKAHIALINAYLKSKYRAESAIKGYEELTPEVSIIRAGYFFDQNLPENDEALATFSKELKSKKAVIFDMRKYPQAPGLFYHYLPTALGKPAFNFARYYRASLQRPGSFVNQESIETYMSKNIVPLGEPYKGQIVVLTNENTQSMGEWFTMMLRQFNPRAVVLGSQTAGADGDEKQLDLPGGYQFIFTGNGIFYPNGKETQRMGIVPDIRFKPTVIGMASGADEQLQKAIDYINSTK